jgi:hypothetical protein
VRTSHLPEIIFLTYWSDQIQLKIANMVILSTKVNVFGELITSLKHTPKAHEKNIKNRYAEQTIYFINT